MSEKISGDTDFDSPDFVLDRAIQRMLPKRRKIRVFGQPLEITIAEAQSAIERLRGQRKFTVQAVAAGEIIKNERIRGLKARKLFVHIQAAFELAALSVVVAENLQRFDVLLVATDNSFHEADLDVQFASFFTR